MAKLIDTAPDKVEQLPGGQWLFSYAGGKDLNSLPVGAKYIIVYSPTIYNAKGRVILYRIAMGSGTTVMLAMMVKERELTTEEIAHFAGPISP